MNRVDIAQKVPASYDRGTWADIVRTILGLLPNFSQTTASLSSDVSLNNTGSYFDGPSISVGTKGIWVVFGTVTLKDGAGAAQFNVKLWDGTTVVASTNRNTAATNDRAVIALSGIFTSPAGNLRISVQDSSSTSGLILFNQSGSSKDSTITAVRIG